MARPRKPRAVLPPHVHAVHSHGREYYYYQLFRNTSRQTKAVAIPGTPFATDGKPNEDWWSTYHQLAGTGDTATHGTFSSLIAVFSASPEWNELSASTQQLWRPLLDRVEKNWGSLPVVGLEPRHVLALRDKYTKHPGVANNMIRALSAMLTWSIPRGWRTTNPCTGPMHRPASPKNRRRLRPVELAGN